MLFLFFNADLVQSKIDSKGGSIAFVDDYSAWITGLMAEANRDDIQAIIDWTLAWGRYSRVTFKYDKIIIAYLICIGERTSKILFIINSEEVKLKVKAKLLGVAIDIELRFKEYMAKTATKGLLAAIYLKRLRILPLAAAR